MRSAQGLQVSVPCPKGDLGPQGSANESNGRRSDSEPSKAATWRYTLELCIPCGKRVPLASDGLRKHARKRGWKKVKVKLARRWVPCSAPGLGDA